MLKTTNNLLTHEWIVIAFLMILLMMLTLSSHSSNYLNIPEVEQRAHSIIITEFEVTIEGAVENPGKYLVKRGSTIEDLVLLSSPKTTADLNHLKMKSLLKKGQCIKVPNIKMIKFFLKFKSGTVEELTVRKGTRILDLPNIYSFKEDVDIGRFNKKRFLKEGETVVVNIKKGLKTVLETEFNYESKNN